MAKKEVKVPADKLALYEKLIATNKKIERKGLTVPYTSANGRMFTLVDEKGVVAIRLPEKEREEFLKKYKTSLHVAYGIVMKEFVAVPEKLLKETNELKKYLDASFEWVSSLKPKSTTKKKVSVKKKVVKKK